MITALTPIIGVRGWAAWTIQKPLMLIASLLLIVAVRRSTRNRLVTIVAAVLLVLTLSYNIQRYGYDLWQRANKQNSVMSP
jgi:uncharacterized membrane protein YwaF